MADLAMALIRSASLDDIASLVLENAKRLTGSPFGFVGYIDPETEHLISLTLTGDIWDACQVPGKTIVFETPRGLWGWVLEHRVPLLSNEPRSDPRSTGTPAGHIPIERFLCVPAIVGEQLVGEVALVNAGHDYTDQDLAVVQRLALLYAIAIQQMRSEDALRKALAQARESEAKVTGLLDGARAVLRHRAFADSARRIFAVCKDLMGATAGYVSLLTADGTENDVVFLDTGDVPCTVDPDLPMPIRGLRAEAYAQGRPVYDNHFPESPHQALLPAGHARLDSVLFAPLVLEGKVVGLMGLSNKPGGFTDDDARLAAAFSELAAVALMNSRTLEDLERSEEQFRSVVQTAGDAIITVDSGSRIVFWNTAAETMFGLPASEAVGRPLEIIMPERYRARHRAAMGRIGATGQTTLAGAPVEMVGRRRDGREFPMALALSVWRLGDEVFFTGVLQDITQRKQAEEALRHSHEELEARVEARTVELSRANELLLAEIAERALVEAQLRASEERYLQLAEHVDEIFWVYELETERFVYISPRYETVFGRSCQSLYDEAKSFLKAVHREDRARVAEAFRRVGEGYDVEYRILRPDGSLRWITARGFRVPDEKGVVYRVAGVAKDVTAERQAQAALVRTERLAVAGKLAASLAHEVNNPLQSALGCLDLAEEALADGRDVEKYLRVASDALVRTTRVVSHLLDLHRQASTEEMCRQDVRQVVEKVLLLVTKKCELNGIDVVWQAEDDLPSIELMPDAMHQVFLNLVLNAIDAMDQGGTLRVSLSRTAQPLGISAQVCDDGHGIAAENLAMLFDPFYSTKADGLGLGLYNSLSTVQAHGGEIQVQSREGEGSTFTVWLPA